MTAVEIGRGKSGRRAYPLDEIGIVPSRRTRDPEEVSVAWQIDAYRFEMPLVVSPMDSVVSPAIAAQIGGLGGLAVLDLEGLWTRYDDPGADPGRDRRSWARTRPPGGCRRSTPSRSRKS